MHKHMLYIFFLVSFLHILDHCVIIYIRKFSSRTPLTYRSSENDIKYDFCEQYICHEKASRRLNFGAEPCQPYQGMLHLQSMPLVLTDPILCIARSRKKKLFPEMIVVFIVIKKTILWCCTTLVTYIWAWNLKGNPKKIYPNAGLFSHNKEKDSYIYQCSKDDLIDNIVVEFITFRKKKRCLPY